MAFLHLMLLALNSPLFIPVALAGEPAPNAGLAAVSVETGKGGLESQETRITQIARSIVRDRITSSVERRSLEVEEGWMTHIAYDMAKEIGFSQARIEAEKQRLRKRQEAREAMRSSLVDNATVAGIAVGIGIVFLILRGILRMFNRQTETPEGRQRRRMAQKVK
ncbi:MAG: hypothetical protein FJY85_15385, partial [Deltaproteobacteria bacterium]|nr:hypothetical protein [Deltaproteobacteria bacterium]